MPITFDVETTAQRLQSSLATIQWAIAQVPAEWTHRPLAVTPDEWPPAMNLAHLTIYDEFISRPVLEALAAGGDGMGATRSGMEHWFSEDATALSAESIETVLARLTASRESQINTVRSFTSEAFNRPATRLWATGRHGTPPHSAGWVATKTFQHTWEHGNAILRAALFAPRAD